MSVHMLRIHSAAELLSDQLSVIVDMWTPIHRDGLGRTIVGVTEDVAVQIKAAYDGRLTDDKLQRLAAAEQQVQEAKHGLNRAVNRALLDEHESTQMRKMLTGLSIQIIEFANAVLERDPEYRGSWRRWVERRRAWRVRQMESRDVDADQVSSEDYAFHDDESAYNSAESDATANNGA